MQSEMELQTLQPLTAKSLEGHYLELEYEGKIINFHLNSISKHKMDTTSEDICLTAGGQRPRSKTDADKANEHIASLFPDCMCLITYYLHLLNNNMIHKKLLQFAI